MIFTLVCYEKNLGILPLTDFLLKELEREKTGIVGWNYLVEDYSKLIEKLKEESKERNIIVKYIVPKIKFSNQEITYPEALKELSDFIFKVPTYREEIAKEVPLIYYKGDLNAPIVDKIKKYYTS